MGLPVYYGDPLSEHAAQHLELTGIGHLLPLSPYRELNNLAALHFEPQVGEGKVYRLAVKAGKKPQPRHDQALGHLPVAFGEDVTFARLSSLIARGAAIQCMPISTTMKIEDYRTRHRDRLLPLFAFTPGGRIRIATAEESFVPRSGETLIGLTYAETGSEVMEAQRTERRRPVA